VLSKDDKFRILIITPDADVFNELIPSTYREFFAVYSCGLREVNSYLNAADIGVMLRDNCLINKVASPVKFAEYSMSGLMVISNDAVDQVSINGVKIENLMEPSIERIIKEKPEEGNGARLARANIAVKIYGRRAQNEKSKAIYTFSG